MATRARGNGRFSFFVVLAVLTSAGAASGALVFGAVAATGSSFPPVSLGLVALSGSVVLVWGALGRDRPWQHDAETPMAWLERPGLHVVVRNGLALGAGFVSRLGFWLWWTLPLLAFEARSLAAGLLIGAVYGFARLGASALLAVPAIDGRWTAVRGRLAIERRHTNAFADSLFFAATGIAFLVAARLVADHL